MFGPIKKFFGALFRFVFYGRPWRVFSRFFFPAIYYTRGNESAITFRTWFFQKILGFNKGCYWPVHFTSTVRFPQNILIGIDAAPGISPGCYIQAVGKIYIGDYTQIAPNVGLISSNHFMLDIRQHVKDEIKIGKYCRIGMGSIILPGVEIGDFTTVAAGAVVSGSFPGGYCVIGGNPAKMIVDYSENQNIKEKFVRYKNVYEYNGYIASHRFEEFRRRRLKI